MMDTRDRLEEVGKNWDKMVVFRQQTKATLDDYITREETLLLMHHLQCL